MWGRKVRSCMCAFLFSEIGVRNQLASQESEKDNMTPSPAAIKKRSYVPPSTVGRGKAVQLTTKTCESVWKDELVTVELGDSLSLYAHWAKPTVIVSDGGY